MTTTAAKYHQFSVSSPPFTPPSQPPQQNVSLFLSPGIKRHFIDAPKLEFLTETISLGGIYTIRSQRITADLLEI